MEERALIARLHRRAGFGLTGAELDAAVAAGLTAEVARLVRPDGAGAAAAADPFTGLELGFEKGQARSRLVGAADAWLTRMVTTPRPGIERLAWFWHGHLVSAAPKVKSPALLAEQVRLLWRLGGGSFPALVTAITTDPAMLAYLDGSGSSGAEPNENYGRELMELFTLGRTAGYTEADVQVAARALTGYVVRGRLEEHPKVAFVARDHDDAPRTLVGLGGVHDVDTVVAAVTGHPACAPYVAGRLARTVLGPDVGGDVIARLADRFRTSGLDVTALFEATVQELAAGTGGGPVVLAPVPWLVMAEKACGVRLTARARMAGLRAAGQVPFLAPNVAGWPSGEAWFSSAAVVARFGLASAVADSAAADHAALAAAGAADSAALAAALGLGVPFGADTVRDLAAVREPRARLVVALTAPDFVLA